MIRLVGENEPIEKAVFVYKSIGPIMEHNYYCAVCRVKSAVLDGNIGVLLPCWGCQALGWHTKKLSRFALWLRYLRKELP